MLKEPDFVAGMFEFVDVGPDFRLPGSLVGRRLAAAGTAGMKGHTLPRGRGSILEFEKDAADFFNLFVRTEDVLVA